MTRPASPAKAELKIINTDTSDLIPIPETSGNDLADLCRCSVSDRAAIDHQGLSFRSPQMISIYFPSSEKITFMSCRLYAGLKLSHFHQSSFRYLPQNSFAVTMEIFSNSCIINKSLSPLTIYIACASLAQLINLSSSGSRHISILDVGSTISCFSSSRS